jgi:hypothetical protein
MMRFIRTRLFLSLIVGALLAGGVTSAAMAAQHQAHRRQCYSVCPTRTSLVLSTHVVVYGHENRVRFFVAVRSGILGIRSVRGTVAVRTRGVTLCTVRIFRGTGSCSPGRRALRPQRRPYRIQAFYGGSSTFGPSRSNVQPLRVINFR